MLKPNDEYGGTGVTLGWEADEARVGHHDSIARSAAHRARGSCRSGSTCAASCSRSSATASGAVIGDMLVDCAPYLFRGKLAGFLTRLSATGLANVTSGGGQVPSFVVNRRA